MAKVTKRAIEALKPHPAGRGYQNILWDDDLKGFGVICSAGGVKSFICQYRLRSRRTRRMVIGRCSVFSPDEARAEARLLLQEVARGRDPADARKVDRTAITIRSLCEEYLAKAEAGLLVTRQGEAKKARTLRHDRGRIEGHILPLIGHRAVKDFTRNDGHAFMHAVQAGKTASDTRKESGSRSIVRGGPTAAARTMGLFGAIMGYAVDAGYRDDNPVRGIRKPADRKRKIRLDPDQYRALGETLGAAELDISEHWQTVAALRLLVLTGCRREEVLALKWSEVDEAERVLRLQDTKTGESLRPLGTAAIDVLRMARQHRRGVYVFPGIRDTDKPFGGLPPAWARLRKAAGLTIPLHGLRHAFASVAKDLDFADSTVGGLLGHAVQGVTGNYGRKADRTLIAAADAVSRSIANAMTGEPGQVVELPRSAKGR